MDASEIKRRVSMEQVLTHYGHPPNEKGVFRCPFPANHNNGDANPSGAISKGRAYCHSQNCLSEKGSDVFALVGLVENLQTFPEQKAWIETTFGLINGTLNPKKNNRKKIDVVYDYTDEDGNLLFQTVRYVPKDFRQRRPDGAGEWIWNLNAIRLVLYRLPEVMKATHVVILEGEKDVEAAYHLGLPPGYAATTAPMGAGKWRADYSESLRGKTVIICPDQDEPGQRHGQQVAHALVSMNSREVAG